MMLNERAAHPRGGAVKRNTTVRRTAGNDEAASFSGQRDMEYAVLAKLQKTRHNVDGISTPLKEPRQTYAKDFKIDLFGN